MLSNGFIDPYLNVRLEQSPNVVMFSKEDTKINWSIHVLISSNLINFEELSQNVTLIDDQTISLNFDMKTDISELFWDKFTQKLETLTIIYPFVTIEFSVFKVFDHKRHSEEIVNVCFEK